MDNITAYIDACVERFLAPYYEMVVADVGLSRSSINDSGFPIFELANEEYYAYEFQQRKLECKIRELLVKPILLKLFDSKEETMVSISTERYPFATNASVEKIIPYCFLIDNKKTRIGYCLTEGLRLKDIVKAAENQFCVDKTVVIDWVDENNPPMFPLVFEEEPPYELITLKQFFLQYFDKETYLLFVKKIKDAVSTANSCIGFKAIPKLSLAHLPELKEESALSIKSFKEKEKIYLPLIKEEHEERAKSTAPWPLNNDSLSKLDKSFFQNELYLSLLGNEDFAKSFWTSEYLMGVFDDEGDFDFTAVACGYFKSVEQLAYKLVLITMNRDDHQDRFITAGNNARQADLDKLGIKHITSTGKRMRVLLTKEALKYFDTTLKSLIFCLCDNYSCWRIEKKEVSKVLFSLKRYASECRNDHFHKDKLQSRAELETIRHDTLLVLYYLLGGYIIPGSLAKQKSELGITWSYDEFYSKMYRHWKHRDKIDYFILSFADGSTYSAKICDEQESLKFNGYAVKSSIRFTLRNGTSEIVVSRNHFPREAWFISKKGKQPI